MEYLKPKQNLKKTVLFLLCSFILATANADGDESDKPYLQRTNAQPVVEMNDQVQVTSGLKTVVVSSARHQAEFEVIGKVISLEPLLTLRERYLVANAELSGAKARLKQSGQSLQRQQDLFQNGAMAKRFIQDQEAQVLSDQAIVDVSQVRLMKIKSETRLLWGNKIAELALSGQSNKLAGFLSGDQFILQITLPTNKQLDSKIDTIFVEPNGNRSKAYPAVLLSRSAQVDNGIPGESYFFQVSAANLRTGMKVTAWIPELAENDSGVIVPESALIWYMDQVYVYIKTSKDNFIRRMIKSFLKIPEGYFIAKDIKEGEAVVVTGGQMLLSEEMRVQIPDED